MKTTLNASSCRRSRIASRRPSVINPHVYSLMTIPFPVFTNDDNGRVVPTITQSEFAQLSRYAE